MMKTKDKKIDIELCNEIQSEATKYASANYARNREYGLVFYAYYAGAYKFAPDANSTKSEVFIFLIGFLSGILFVVTLLLLSEII